MTRFNSTLHFFANAALVGILLNAAENVVFGCDNNSTFANIFNVSISVGKSTEVVLCAVNLAPRLAVSVPELYEDQNKNSRNRRALSSDKKNFLKLFENYISLNTMTAITDNFMEALPTAKLSANNNYCKSMFLPGHENFDEQALNFNMDAGKLIHHDVGSWINSVEKYTLFRDHECYKNNDDSFVRRLDDAIGLIDAVLDELSLENIALSFNGGKDCTVLLHLLRVAIDRKYGTNERIQAVYINCDDSFPEISSFINETCERYKIDLYEYPGPIKVGLQQLKMKRPGISAILMGSRSTDPHGVYMKSKRQWTDEGWPQYLRIFPILDWSYGDVWRALIGLRVQYCSLYDQGYTSLGDKKKTGKNDALKIIDEYGKTIGYRPAYELNIGSLERLGRKSTEV